MRIGKLWDLRQADARLVKAQLDFAYDVFCAWRILNPLWMTLFALTCSEAFPVFGHVPTRRALILPVLAVVVVLCAQRLFMRYRTADGEYSNGSGIEGWFRHFMVLQVLMSAIWGLAPWLLWQPDNLPNHIYLGAVMLGIIGASMIKRANRVGLFLVAILPQAGLAILRFVLSGTAPDLVMALVIAAAIAQFWFDGRKIANCVTDHALARIRVEDLARELKHTRDEALHKRFEAETANASKTRFLANMSHELRTPLNAILGFSEIIEKECFGPTGSPRYKEYAGDINESGKHLLNLINDMLDVAKIEAGRMTIDPVLLDIPYVIDCVLRLTEAKAHDKKQEISVHLPADLPFLFADERALKQILINLISNAIKFTPEGGQITITGDTEDGVFRLTVEDNGPGMPCDVLEGVFAPFNRADNRYDSAASGTGLGLALVRGLASLHGGRAWMESEPGKGCRACVTLPGLTEPVEAIDPAVEAIAPMAEPVSIAAA